MAIFWLYWLALGVAALCAAALVFITYAKTSPVRQWRWALLFVAAVASIPAYGFMAFKVSYNDRPDGSEILFGRWWLIAGRLIPLLVSIAMGYTSYELNLWGTAFGALLFGGGLLGMAYTPSNGGTEHLGPLISWLCWSFLVMVVMGVWHLFLTTGFQRLLGFPAEPKRGEGRAVLQNYVWHIAAVVAAGVLMAAYLLFISIGPEAWDVFPGGKDARESWQIGMTLLVDLLFALLAGVAYFMLDPTGDVDVIFPGGVLPLSFGKKTRAAAAREHTHDTEGFIPSITTLGG